MGRPFRLATLALLVMISAACYHQIVRTGRPAGTTVIDRPWVSTWLWGLVPAKDIDVRQECPSGVAIVETQQSFVNGLVGALTLGIYTPQRVRVTCASAGTSLGRVGGEFVIENGASAEQRTEVFGAAVAAAERTDLPVVVRF